jgi:hypothetical protein
VIDPASRAAGTNGSHAAPADPPDRTQVWPPADDTTVFPAAPPPPPPPAPPAPAAPSPAVPPPPRGWGDEPAGPFVTSVDGVEVDPEVGRAARPGRRDDRG